MEESARKEIKEYFEKIAEAPYKKLEAIRLKNLDLNPFLLRALALNTPEAIAGFMVSQRMERSLVTTFGVAIQNVAKALSEGTGTEGADIMAKIEGKRYYIQMKAGPNNINKDIMAQINSKLASATRRDPGSVGMLGLSYGKRERVNTIIQRYSEINYKVGREFWTFLSGDEHCADEVFELAGQAVHEVSMRHGGKDYREYQAETVQRLADDLRKKYGDGDQMWQAIFRETM